MVYVELMVFQWVEGIIPEGQLSRLGAFGNFLHSVIRVRNFLV